MRNIASILKLALLACGLQLSFCGGLSAGAPLKINFQGRLDESGQPAEGSKTFVFKIYDAVSGGSLVWTSASQSLALSQGVFSASLSAGTPAALSTATFAGARFVEITVDGVTLSPRQEMVSAPYALVAQALAPDAEIPSSSIGAGSVNDSHVVLTTGAITSGRFSDDRVLITTGAFAALNGADQLVKLDGTGKLPAADGSLLTGVTVSAANLTGTVTDSGVSLTTAAIVSGKFSDDRVLITTGAFAALNGADQLVKLDGTGKLPAADGSQLTGLPVPSGAVAKAGSTMTGQLTLAGSTLTVTGAEFSVGGSVLNVGGGKVGVGTASPNYKLDVQGGSVNASAGLCIADNCKSSWASIDNLGSHTASQALNMAGFSIHNVSTLTVAGAAFSVGGSTFTVAAGRVGVGTNLPASTLSVGGSLSLGIRTLAEGTHDLGEGDHTLLTDASVAAVIVNLPDPAAAVGRVYVIKAVNVDNGVTINAVGSTIDNNPGPFSLTAVREYCVLQSGGAGWHMIGGDMTLPM